MTMDLRERIAADIDRRLARLRGRFGEFPVETDTVENDLEFFERGRDLAADGWRGDAGAWVEDPDGRVLLIRHEDADEEWGVPGGGHEPGERFEETARREVREETGIDVEISGVWRARRKTFVHAADPDRQLEMLTVWFEAETDEGRPDPSIGDPEIEAARWFSEPPSAVAGFLESRIDRWDWPGPNAA